MGRPDVETGANPQTAVRGGARALRHFNAPVGGTKRKGAGQPVENSCEFTGAKRSPVAGQQSLPGRVKAREGGSRLFL